MNSKKEKHNEEELKEALGEPKYYIDTTGLKDGETYSWFPTRGNSMTDKTHRSIPSGSMVLGRCLKLNSVSDIPLHRPIVVIIDDNGIQYCMLKCGCKIQKANKQETSEDAEMLCLRSYNPAPWCADFWLPFSCIKFVFLVERVRLPNGKEFVPKEDGEV